MLEWLIIYLLIGNALAIFDSWISHKSHIQYEWYKQLVVYITVIFFWLPLFLFIGIVETYKK